MATATFITTANTPVGAGNATITAVYSGTPNAATVQNFATSTSAGVTQTVNSANTSTALTVSGGMPGGGTSSYGEALTLTATVTDASDGTVTPSGGTVTFFLNGSTVLGTANVKKTGVATLTTAAVGVGSNQLITASYSGTTNSVNSVADFAASPLSSAATQTVTTASTSVTVTAATTNPSSPTYGQTLTFTATVTDTTDPSATITNGNGTVTFYDGSVSLGSVPVWGGIATLGTGQVSAGTNSITAKYNGYIDPATGLTDLTPSAPSPAITQTVGTASTSVTLAAAPGQANSSVYGVPLTFTATVTDTSPGASNVIPQMGIVTLYNNGNEITALAVSKGTASFTFPYAPYYYPALAVSGSPYSLTATYTAPNNANGVPNFNTSNSNSTPVSQTITAASTSTSVTAAPATAAFHQSVTFTATITNNDASGLGGCSGREGDLYGWAKRSYDRDRDRGPGRWGPDRDLYDVETSQRNA